MDNHRARRKPLPDWYLAEPRLEDGEDWFMDAFRRLNTEKMGGPQIPDSRIMAYADRHGLDYEAAETLGRMVRGLDSVLNAWSDEDQKRRASVEKDRKK